MHVASAVLFGCLFVTISLCLPACCPPTYVTNHVTIREKHVLQINSVMVIMLSSVCVSHLIFPFVYSNWLPQQGVRSVKQTDLNAVYVLVKPPSMEVLVHCTNMSNPDSKHTHTC